MNTDLWKFYFGWPVVFIYIFDSLISLVLLSLVHLFHFPLIQIIFKRIYYSSSVCMLFNLLFVLFYCDGNHNNNKKIIGQKRFTNKIRILLVFVVICIWVLFFLWKRYCDAIPKQCTWRCFRTYLRGGENCSEGSHAYRTWRGCIRTPFKHYRPIGACLTLVWG